MKQTNGFGKSPHSIWETNKLTLQEKTTLLFILDRANRFGKENKEFNLSYEDFKKAGFDVRAVRKTRKTLIDLNLINYKEGHTGKGSTYSINWQQIVNLSIEAEIKPVESPKEEKGIDVPTETVMPKLPQRIINRDDDLTPAVEIIKQTSRGSTFEYWTMASKSKYEECLNLGYTNSDIHIAYNRAFNIS